MTKIDLLIVIQLGCLITGLAAWVVYSSADTGSIWVAASVVVCAVRIGAKR